MIGYLEGTILLRDDERILLLANQVGYEVLLPVFVMESLADKSEGDAVSLFIYFHQTERQPRPALIGFNSEEEKAFFQLFVSVEAIGPLKAVKALHLPVHEIAEAIESGNADRLKHLKGIGARTAQKIIATLGGKMGRFAAALEKKAEAPGIPEIIVAQVREVLVTQLGYKTAEAGKMLSEALEKHPSVSTPEELLDAILKRGGQEQPVVVL